MSLPEPSFIDRDPVVITAELKSHWESATGKTLYPGQVEALLIDLLAYRESLVRIGIQEAAKQNLVAFARAPMLDYLGELVGVYRIDNETDDQLRERIKLAPESFSTAGSRGSYLYHAKSADSSIVDVAIDSPSPGVVAVYPLCSTGVPTQAVLDAVLAICSAEDVRPLTDDVQVFAPAPVDYTIAVTVTPYQWPDRTLVQQQATAALTALAAELQGKLGQDVTTSRVIAAAHLDGVYRVTVQQPAADLSISFSQFARCGSITVTLMESVNG